MLQVFTAAGSSDAIPIAGTPTAQDFVATLHFITILLKNNNKNQQMSIVFVWIKV